MYWRLCLIAFFTLAGSLFGAEGGDATIAGSEQRIRTRRLEKTLLLHIDDVAKAFDLDAKVVTAGKLITLCTKGENGFCYPLRVNQIPAQKTENGWYVDASTLVRILRLEISQADGKVQLKNRPPDRQPEQPDFERDVTGQAEGRGFRVGQTLPDIPLYDMDGEEVRFSRFLGKQYIIYCWASW